MKVTTIALSVLGLLLACSMPGFATMTNINYQLTQINKGVYIFTRSWDAEEKFRSNIGVIIAEQGVTLINPLWEDSAEQLLEKVKTITDKPIVRVLTSNWDWHNNGSNDYFRNMGATVISHENVRYFENTRPQHTFSHKLTIDLGGEQLTAYKSNGHSMGHINIYLHNANVIFMSDSYRDQWLTTPGPYGIEGHLQGIQSALDMTNEQTKYVPGNTSSSVYLKRKDLIREIAVRERFHSLVWPKYKSGESIAEIAQDKQIQDLFKNNFERYPEYGKNIHLDVTAAIYGEKLKRRIREPDFSDYLGLYKLPDESSIEVIEEGGYLFARKLDGFYYLLAPELADKFKISWFRERFIEFVRVENKVVGMRFLLDENDNRFGQEAILERLKDIPMIKKINI